MARGLWDTCKTLDRSGDGSGARARDADGQTILGCLPALMIGAMSPSEIFGAWMLGGTTALVTGGGTGLGKATALELARCGACVTIAGRREDVLAEAAAEIGEFVGAGVLGSAGGLRGGGPGVEGEGSG